MIPLRATNYVLSNKWPKYIILHHTACIIDDPEFRFNLPVAKITRYNQFNYKIGNTDTNFHFILEQQGNDYQVIVSQPLLTKCVFIDIPQKFENSVHIALFGNYNVDIPSNRIYKVLAYRILFPLMRTFLIKDEDILFHAAVSEFKISCPGEFVDKKLILNALNSIKRNRAVSRS